MNTLAALLVAVTLSAPGLSAVGIHAHHGTVYQTKKAGQQTQGFFEIDNTGPVDVLNNVTCPVAGATLLAGADGKPITSLAIPAGQVVNLTPNGPHLLLQATHFAVQYGGILPCSLNFQNAGTISIYLYAMAWPGA